jgi:outer membrane usher protein
MKSEQAEVGSTGWRLRGSYGQSDIIAASGSYRSQIGRIEAGVEKYDDNVRATAQIDGAVVLAGGGVFLSNRIDDAFSVVDVGAPDVDVQFENRPMGKTNKSGKMLLPNLRSYDKNVISIDPSNLPIDATVGETRQVVSPSDRGGSVVDFNVKADTRAPLSPCAMRVALTSRRDRQRSSMALRISLWVMTVRSILKALRMPTR